MALVQLLKAQGNKAFAAKDWDTAIDLFTQAIHLDPQNHVLFSNRSAAYAGKKQWDDALKDADAVRTPLLPVARHPKNRVLSHPLFFFSLGARQCIQINSNWGKGYARKGAALHGAHKWDEAIAAYEQGIKVEDSPALKKGLQEVMAARGTSRFTSVPLPAARNSDDSYIDIFILFWGRGL